MVDKLVFETWGLSEGDGRIQKALEKNEVYSQKLYTLYGYLCPLVSHQHRKASPEKC